MDVKKMLEDAAFGKLPREETLLKVMAEYSKKIATAINPVSFETAPIIIATLREYANEVINTFPEAEKFADGFMKRPRVVYKEKV